MHRFGLCQQFADAIILEENNRLDKNDPDAVLFEAFLSRFCNRKNADEDLIIVGEMQSSYYRVQ